MSDIQHDIDELEKAKREFFEVVAKELHIYDILNWLTKKLKGVTWLQ